MNSKPRTEADYIILAVQLADAGVFANANAIRDVLRHWGPETERWWTDELSTCLARRCRQVAEHTRLS